MQYLRNAIESSRGGCSSSSSRDDDDDDDDYEAPELLRKDASRPLEEVMASYCVSKVNKFISAEKGPKPASPFLRGQRDTSSHSGASSSSSAKERTSAAKISTATSSDSCSSITAAGDSSSEHADESSNFYLWGNSQACQKPIR